MIRETNIEKIRKTALMFLYLDVEYDGNPFGIVTHPFLENRYTVYNNTMIDITESEEALNEYRNRMSSLINKQTNPESICFMLRKQYRLTFLKHIKNYLSREDFSRILIDAYVSSENPNHDVNVSKSTLISWFKYADKNIMMDEDDRKAYESLPDTVTIYRGISTLRGKKGISWTLSRKTADWFASRFNPDTQVVMETTVSKKEILLYTNQRNEQEIIIDPKILRNKNVIIHNIKD